MDRFASRLLAWYDEHGRKELPWQQEPTPYRVWVSEIMLQQTQVATVIPYYQRFMATLPDVQALATAPEDTVLGLWSGLGYYSRARNLHRAAQIVVTEHQGHFPDTLEGITTLPGIGRSTGAAILSLALGQRQAILDGNVKRVLSRFHAVEGWPGQSAVQKRLWELAEQHTPDGRNAAYTQAIMDLGATLCARKPDCSRCPLRGDCQALAEGEPARYPTPKPRKSLPVRHTRMLLLRNPQGAILLEKRPPTGIWGGLWSLPECPVETPPERHVREVLGLGTDGGQAATGLRHTFSHFHLDIEPWQLQTTQESHSKTVADDPRYAWFAAEQLNGLGLPAPVKRLLETPDPC